MAALGPIDEAHEDLYAFKPSPSRALSRADDGEERYSSQLAASARAGAEQLGMTSVLLQESVAAHATEKRAKEDALNQVEHLKSIIKTLELSVEQYSRECATLSAENTEMKSQVRDFKNQLTASRASSELLVDSNSRLSGEVSDVRQELREAKAIVEALQKDVKSYELLQQSQPSYMYAEMMAQTRLGLQDDNSRLQDEVYLLKARMESLPPTGSSYLSPSSSLVGRGNSSSPSAAPASAAASPSASPDSTRTVAASHGGGQELLPGSPPQAAY